MLRRGGPRPRPRVGNRVVNASVFPWPPCAYHPSASLIVTALSAILMTSSSASAVLALADRRISLTRDHIFSIGLKPV
jgi:hypothetical protein